MNNEEVYPDKTGLEIAVIGMASRFPGAKNIAEFWENLKNGVESIAFCKDEELVESGIDPRLLEDPAYVKAGGSLDNIDYFDATFFGFTPIDARVTDPQMRLFLECTWEALEDAGYDPGSYSGLIGLFAGASDNITWKVQHLLDDADNPNRFLASLLNNKDFMSLLVSYKLDLKGPSFTMYTACSSSLTAIHLACQATLNGECDMALAGGVTIYLPNRNGYRFQENMIFSPDGHCRTFDARARGTIFGSGVGIVLLKRFEDAIADRDHIYAIIKGSALNNDGLRKVGFTAPSIDGQAEVIRTAQQMAHVEPESIGYLEAHGTATELGDPVEIEALKSAFNTDKRNFCAIGSVKSNVGHLDSASGIAGFIKAVLALKHRLIPPSLHFEAPNPGIDFENSPFYVNRELKEWKRDNADSVKQPLCAAVSSFGIGGTNAHVILEEWIDMASANVFGGVGTFLQKGSDPPEAKSPFTAPWLFLLSARTPQALERMTQNFADHLKNNPEADLTDAVYTLALGRKQFKYRRMTVCSSREEAIEIFSSPEQAGAQMTAPEDEERPLIFMFSGQGSQYVNMGLGLYKHEPLFREAADDCFHILETQLGYDIKSILYPDESGSPLSHEEAEQKMDDVIFSGPIKFTFEYALARLMLKWGFMPAAMIGHSFGEYAAAQLSGVFSLEDALKLVALRGKLMYKTPPGAMMSVPIPAEELRTLLNENISLSAVNTDSLCNVSGPLADVDTFEQELKDKGHECLRINFPRASHSKMMRAVSKEFAEVVGRVKLNNPQIPYISGLSGDWITPGEAANPAYWARHLTDTIRFSDGIKKLLENRNPIFVQVGCDRGLPLFIGQLRDAAGEEPAVNLVRHRKDDVSDIYYILNSIGRLWLLGCRVNWGKFLTQRTGRRISLPTYPFEREQYRVEGSLLKKGLEMMRKLASPGTENLQDNSNRQAETRLLQEIKPAAGTGEGHPDLKPRPHLMKNPYAAPGNELEQKICDIWKKLFGFAQIGIDDDFYELGGDSTRAIILSSQINKIGCHIALADVLANPTIKELASFIGESVMTKELEDEIYEQRLLNELDCLVKLNKGHNEQNIFLVHDNQGMVNRYNELALLLETKYNVYGIQPGEVKTGSKMEESPQKKIDNYLEQILAFQEVSPYIIGGFSDGDSFAYEIALGLEKLNRRVKKLILLDSPIFFAGSRFMKNRLLRYFPGFVREMIIHSEIVKAPLLVLLAQDSLHPAAARKRIARMTKSEADIIAVPGKQNTILEKPYVERLAEIIINKL